MNQSGSKTILMSADTVGGVWTYTLELTKALRKHDVTVYLACMGKKLTDSQWKAADELPNLVIKESNYALEWMDNPWRDVERAGKWLLSLEQQIQPDLVHLNGYVHGALPFKAPVVVVGHSCVLSWWNAVKKEEAPEQWNEYAARVEKGLQEADCVVAVSQNMLKSLEHYYGPFFFSKVIYNGRDHRRFHPAQKKELIFSMGRLWDEGKNIAALNAVADELPWPIHVAGDHRNKIEEGESFHLLGSLSSKEVAKQLSVAGIYVLPARYEPFGLSALEAALSGCALVLGDIPTLREVWGDAALYADPTKPLALRHQIQRLIQNTAHRQYLARKARERAARYTIKRLGHEYLQLYRELLSAGDYKKMAAE